MSKFESDRIQIDISNVFTEGGIKKLSKGQLLRFSKAEFIITRLNKKSGIVMAKRVHTRRPEDVAITDENGKTLDFITWEKEKNND
jgi:hypothetical protein